MPVVVEKAFTQSVEEADHIIKISEETGKILTCFQNRRWDSDFLTMRHLVEVYDIAQLELLFLLT